MANEATVRVAMSVRRSGQSYSPPSASYRADVAGQGGPTPGNILVTAAGVDVDLSQLTGPPGLCRLENVGASGYIEYGVWDGVHFQPLGEMLPGEAYIVRLSRWLGYEFGTGSGTEGSGTRLRLRCSGAATCRALVEAFDA